MIYVTGDTHGDVDYKKLLLLKKKNPTRRDYLIICGDVAICWSKEELSYFKDLYNFIGCTIIYVDGNHENFQMLNEMPLVEYKGALMHQIDKHIFHVLRGEIMTLNGKTFLCLGGASSTDKASRIPYVSWWPEEEITNSDVGNALKNLANVKNEVDYVITHCCDTITSIEAFGFRGDNCTNQLQFIDKIVKYKHWFFGHYHVDRNLSSKKTCLYNCIVQIQE